MWKRGKSEIRGDKSKEILHCRWRKKGRESKEKLYCRWIKNRRESKEKLYLLQMDKE